MKRYLNLFLVLALLVLSFSLFSCEKSCVDNDADGKCDDCGAVLNTPDEPEDPEGPKDPDSTDEISLIENGEANFKFVMQRKAPSNVVKAVDNIIKKLKDYDIVVEKVYDEDAGKTDCEVLIDVPTTRGDAYAYDTHDLGEKGYLIKLIDGKVMIAGGSNSALVDAIEVFAQDYLGIKRNVKEITDVKFSASQNLEVIQDDYRVTGVKLNGKSMKGYTIAANSKNEYAYNAAVDIQTLFYTKTGLWFNIVPLEDADKSIVLNIEENTYEGNGYTLVVEDDQIVFNIEFPDKLRDITSSFFSVNIGIAAGEVDFTAKTHNETKNLRDIYYSEFGALGDGMNDDFLEMMACHEYANKWGHNVKADKGKTYYIGKENGGETITVLTDTDWQGCRIVIDDSNIDPTKDKKIREASIFNISSNTKMAIVTSRFQSKKLKIGDTNIGYAPGYAGVLTIFNSNVKHHIRYGVNADAGQPQQESILVDKDGNIDPSTPILWNYEVITTAYYSSIEDRPISVGNAIIDNISNQAPNYYTAYHRNIVITRAHTTVYDIDHSLLNEGPTRAPYRGIARPDKTYDITIKNIKAQWHQSRYDADTGAALGTYEFGAGHTIEVRWIDCYQKNFYADDGSVKSRGLFGTGYCRNVLLENCFLTSFDAHQSLSNATLRNSTFEHINFIGNGDIILENVNIYCQPSGGNAITLRTDYGATWNGNVYIDGLCFKYADEKKVKLSIVAAAYTDHNFGYTCYFPQNFYIKNVTSKQVVPSKSSSNRTEADEIVLAENKLPIHLAKNLEKHWDCDISKFTYEGGSADYGVYIGSKTVNIESCPNVPEWVLPNTPQFKDMKVYINGEELINWKTVYGSKIGDE